MKKKKNSLLLLLFVLLGCSAQSWISQGQTPLLSYEVVNEYPHDASAFTEGLLFDDESQLLFESTGLFGKSTLRTVDLETGDIISLFKMNNTYFAEGICIFNNTLYQLTWTNGFAFEYGLGLQIEKRLNYSYQGWGLTTNGTHLIASDGTSTIRFFDDSLNLVYSISVVFNGQPLVHLNELEYINGSIWANIWFTNLIAIINPDSGMVEALVNCTGLINPTWKKPGVQNGIAYSNTFQRLFVTGKNWPSLFEIRVVSKSNEFVQ